MEWISVDDRLPQEGQKVLRTTNGTDITVVIFTYNEKYMSGKGAFRGWVVDMLDRDTAYMRNVSTFFWQPLPKY